MLFQHFDLNLTFEVLFYIFCPAVIPRDQPWRYRTDNCSCKLSANVSLMLDNLLPVPSLSKLNHIKLYFIQISIKITCKQLIPFRKSYLFFEVIPGVLGHSVNFNITQRFLLRWPVFPDYPFLVTLI